MSGFLTAEQVEFYRKNGYLVLESFWEEAGAVRELKESMGMLLASFDYTGEEAGVFSTDDQSRKSDAYFLTSGDKIRFFWEEKAWQEGRLVKEPEVAINKVGHALHDMDPTFQKYSYEDRVVSICHDLGLVRPVAVQSMYIFKQAFIGGAVNAHQDGAFLYTRPQSVLGLWWALDDCTLDNGCLWAVPGSHALGVHRRFKRRADGKEGTEFEPPTPVDWDVSQAVPLVIPAGSLVLLHSALVHFSKENSSPAARHAYSIHVVDGRPGVDYPSDNWLQRDETSHVPFVFMDDRSEVYRV